MNNLTAYETLALSQAVKHQLNSLYDSYQKLKEKAPIGVKERAEQNYYTLLSAAHKLKLNIDLEVEVMN